LRRSALATLSGSFLAACSVKTIVVPILGLLVEKQSLSTGVFIGTHGDVSIAMPNGSKRKGKWTALDDAVSTSGSVVGEYLAE